jgi:hypothetical protein
MATGVSTINKDILRYFQTQNLLAPPEAIELTKLYNEMSELLKKPVKFKNEPMQLHLFYDLLSQYGKHLTNLKLAASPDIPSIPTPPPKTSALEPSTLKVSKTSSAASSPASSTKTLAGSPPQLPNTPPSSSLVTPSINEQKTSQDTIDDNDIDLTPSPIPSPPKSVIKQYMKLLKPISDVPENVLRMLRENDTTFQLFPDVHEMIINGRKISTTNFLSLLEKLRNPEFRAPTKLPISSTEPFYKSVLDKITSSVMSANERDRSKVLKQLQGLQNHIASKTRVRRRGFYDSESSMSESPLTSTTTAPPTKLNVSGQGRIKKSKHAVVKWKRWQNHIQPP